jgi:hypothetical protein
MLGLYKDVAILAAKRAAQSWLAAVAIPIYVLVVVLVAFAAAPLGLIGGLIVGFVAAACFGGYLSLVAIALDGTRMRLADLKNGLRAVRDVLGVFFLLFVISYVLGQVRAGGSSGVALAGVASLAIAVFFNALPEVIYQRGATFIGAFSESASFVTENAFAWFPPNLVFAFVILWATNTLTLSSPGELLVRLGQLGSVSGVLRFILGSPHWMWPLLIAFVHFAMVFRGLLFRELSSGSTRMRAFRRRMGA